MGESLDRRSDLYSMGSVLFECVAGRRMWGAGTDLDVLRRLALEDPPSWARSSRRSRRGSRPCTRGSSSAIREPPRNGARAGRRTAGARHAGRVGRACRRGLPALPDGEALRGGARETRGGHSARSSGRQARRRDRGGSGRVGSGLRVADQAAVAGARAPYGRGDARRRGGARWPRRSPGVAGASDARAPGRPGRGTPGRSARGRGHGRADDRRRRFTGVCRACDGSARARTERRAAADLRSTRDAGHNAAARRAPASTPAAARVRASALRRSVGDPGGARASECGSNAFLESSSTAAARLWRVPPRDVRSSSRRCSGLSR